MKLSLAIRAGWMVVGAGLGLCGPAWGDAANGRFYLKASNTGRADQFGWAIAASGNTLVVGAPGEASTTTGVNGDQNSNKSPSSGAVYVFVRNGDTWTQQAYLKASNNGAGDKFGYSVAIDGDLIVVGAPYEDGEATTTPAPTPTPILTGNNVVINAVGPEIVVEQPTGTNVTDGGSNNFGSVAVGSIKRLTFTVKNTGDENLAGVTVNKDGPNTTDFTLAGQPTSVIAPNSSASFIVEFKPSATGARTAAIHITNNDSDENPFDITLTGTGTSGGGGGGGSTSPNQIGAVYVFSRTGTTWTQQAKLKASNGEKGDFFGAAVAVSGDTLVVGATHESSSSSGVDGEEDNNDLTWSGAAYVFTQSGSNWTQEAYLKASNPGPNDFFGRALAIDGDTLIVGVPDEDGNGTGVNPASGNNLAPNAGAAYLFTRSGSTWTQQAYLKASNTGAGDAFGRSVAVSGDTVVVGAYMEDSAATTVDGDEASNAAKAAGAAYVFSRSGGIWSQDAYLKPANAAKGDNFGWSVALSGDTVIVGAPGEDGNGTGNAGDPSNNSAKDAGAAYLFGWDGTAWEQTAYLKASNTGKADRFGWSAVIGSMIAVGAPQEDGADTGIGGNEVSEKAAGSGAVYAMVAEIAVEQPAGSSLADGGSVDFGSVGVGNTAERVFTLRNLGGDELQSVVATVTGADAANFTLVTPPPANLAPGASATFTLRFAPTAEGAKTAALEIASNDANESPYNLSLAGTAIVLEPEIEIEQPAGTVLTDGGSVDFGSAAVAGSADLEFTVRNLGNAELQGVAATVTGADAADFTLVTPPPANLAPGASATFTLRFAPTVEGAKTAALEITSNDANESPYNLSLAGTATAAP